MARRRKSSYDCSIAHADVIPWVLGDWVLWAAKAPQSYKASIVVERDEGILVELRNAADRPDNGVVFMHPGGCVHLWCRSGPAGGPAVPRSLDEAIAACDRAVRKARSIRRWAWFGKGLLMALLLAALLVTIRFLLW